MSSTRELLINHNLEDLCLGQSTRMGLARFTIVYTVTDGYITQSIRAGRFTLPDMKNQKASYTS
jgi:hypothetical protein